MKKFIIYEFDKDYRTITGSEIKEFKNKKEADNFCEKQSWSGYDYFSKEL